MASSTGLPVSHERWRLTAQWAGILAGPLMFLVLLQTNYVLSYVACETRSTWFLHLATAIALLLVGTAGFLAWRAAMEPPLALEHPDAPDPKSLANTDEVRRQRSAWMSALGVGLSALFILLILAMEIPILVLQECQ